MVGPDSYGISRAPHYSGGHRWRRFRFAYGAFTLCGQLSQHCSATKTLCNSTARLRTRPRDSLYTANTTPAGLTCLRFRLRPFRSPLLRASLTISFPPVTEMFHFTGSPPALSRVPELLPGGFPIQVSTDRRTLAPTRGFSQLAAPFFGVWRQGIPRVPLVP